MKRYLFTFASSVAIGAGLVSPLTACNLSGDCDCRPTPSLPEAQAPLPVKQASSYDARGNELELPIDLSAGTVEVTGDHVVIRYTEGEAE